MLVCEFGLGVRVQPHAADSELERNAFGGGGKQEHVLTFALDHNHWCHQW